MTSIIDPTAHTTRLTPHQIISLIEELRNWGKWGKDDELGTLNYITEDTRLQALKSCSVGRTVSLAKTIGFFQRNGETQHPSRRLMLETGQGREGEDESCNSVNATRRAAKEEIAMVFHGLTITHIDAFSHMFWKGKMYNNRSASDVNSSQGATHNSALPFKNGIVTRGILIDIPFFKGKDWLEYQDGVFLEDLQACAEKCSIQLTRGDAVFIRTGNVKRRDVINQNSEGDPFSPDKFGVPSTHPECMKWFHENEIAILGSDTSNDTQPPPWKEFRHPVHIIALTAMGLPLIDNCDLEELSTVCQELKKWSFLLMLAPLPMEGTTGSPINPLALF